MTWFIRPSTKQRRNPLKIGGWIMGGKTCIAKPNWVITVDRTGIPGSDDERGDESGQQPLAGTGKPPCLFPLPHLSSIGATSASAAVLVIHRLNQLLDVVFQACLHLLHHRLHGLDDILAGCHDGSLHLSDFLLGELLLFFQMHHVCLGLMGGSNLLGLNLIQLGGQLLDALIGNCKLLFKLLRHFSPDFLETGRCGCHIAIIAADHGLNFHLLRNHCQWWVISWTFHRFDENNWSIDAHVVGLWFRFGSHQPSVVSLCTDCAGLPIGLQQCIIQTLLTNGWRVLKDPHHFIRSNSIGGNKSRFRKQIGSQHWCEFTSASNGILIFDTNNAKRFLMLSSQLQDVLQASVGHGDEAEPFVMSLVFGLGCGIDTCDTWPCENHVQNLIRHSDESMPIGSFLERHRLAILRPSLQPA